MSNSKDTTWTNAVRNLATTTVENYLLQLPPDAVRVRSLMELGAEALVEAASEGKTDPQTVFELCRAVAGANLRRRAELLRANAVEIEFGPQVAG